MLTKLSFKQLVYSSFALLLVGLILVYLVAQWRQIPVKQITGDPLLMFQVNPLTGVVSNIGVLLWCAAAAIIGFTQIVEWSWASKEKTFFLWHSGVLTTLLLLDDLFMVHDRIFYAIGLNQYFMYGIYVVLFVLYFVKYYPLFLKSKDSWLFILAFIFLGSSVVIDTVLESEGLQYLFEDGLKLLGIASWTLFFSRYAFTIITARPPYK